VIKRALVQNLGLGILRLEFFDEFLHDDQFEFLMMNKNEPFQSVFRKMTGVPSVEYRGCIVTENLYISLEAS
jgi:hypothetical protein